MTILVCRRVQCARQPYAPWCILRVRRPWSRFVSHSLVHGLWGIQLKTRCLLFIISCWYEFNRLHFWCKILQLVGNLLDLLIHTGKNVFEYLKFYSSLWAGHVYRMPDEFWANVVTWWMPQNVKRHRGRPRRDGRDELDASTEEDWSVPFSRTLRAPKNKFMSLQMTTINNYYYLIKKNNYQQTIITYLYRIKFINF